MQYYSRLRVNRHANKEIQDDTTHLIPGYTFPVLLGAFDVPVVQAQEVVPSIRAVVEVITHDPVQHLRVQESGVGNTQDGFRRQL